MTDWWFQPYPSEKYDFVSRDDDIPNMMGKIKAMFQTTNQGMNIERAWINESWRCAMGFAQQIGLKDFTNEISEMIRAY